MLPTTIEDPLLSKSPPPSSSSIEDDSIDSDHITFNYSPRHFQDLPFLLLFLLFLLATFSLGIFSIIHRNPNSSNLSSFTYSPNSSSCTKSPLNHQSSHLYSFQPQRSNLFEFQLQSSNLFHNFPIISSSSNSSSVHLLKNLVWTLVITLILTAPFVLVLLWLLTNYAKQLVYGLLPFFILIPVFINVYWFVACTISTKCSVDFPLPYRILVLVFVFLVIGVMVWIIVANWSRIELTIRIIGVASNALSSNLGLFALLPSLTFALLVYFVPIVVFLVFAQRNGKIVPRTSSEVEEGVYWCVWKQDAWVPAYYALAILTMMWSSAAMVEAQVYVISGTIAQWYFNKERSKPSRSMRMSLRHAFGPSSGTVCFSGLLIAITRIIRSAVDTARQDEDTPSGMVNLILRCCVNAFLSAIDFLNKFTINFSAITGDSYCSSAKKTYELLRRNLLSAVFVETVSTRILTGIIFVFSAIYGIATCAILKAGTGLGADAYIVAGCAWLLLIVVLGFFVHVLENVIDTIYVCFAIDRDKGEVCKQEVHEVYVSLPLTRNYRPTLGARTSLV